METPGYKLLLKGDLKDPGVGFYREFNEGLMEDSQPNDFQAKLLANGVGIVKTHVKAFRQIPGKRGLEQKMGRMFMKDLNPRYTTLWIWSMTLMRATTAAYAEKAKWPARAAPRTAYRLRSL